MISFVTETNFSYLNTYLLRLYKVVHSVLTIMVLRNKCQKVTRFGSGAPAPLALRFFKIMGRFAPEVNLLLRFTSTKNVFELKITPKKAEYQY